MINRQINPLETIRIRHIPRKQIHGFRFNPLREHGNPLAPFVNKVHEIAAIGIVRLDFRRFVQKSPNAIVGLKQLADSTKLPPTISKCCP